VAKWGKANLTVLYAVHLSEDMQQEEAYRIVQPAIQQAVIRAQWLSSMFHFIFSVLRTGFPGCKNEGCQECNEFNACYGLLLFFLWHVICP
jgi:hypothetical protein